MAANSPQTAAFALTRRVLQQCRQAKSSRATSSLQSASRTFSTTQFRSETDPNRSSFNKFIDPATEQERFAKAKEAKEVKEAKGSRPRWSYTPEGMKAPFSPHAVKDPSRKVWTNNKDPQKLDQMYQRLLGNGGDRLLPEEIRWLAVTHKSFDQGRRGFNDRLAFLGRQAVVLEVAQSILSSTPGPRATVEDEHGRAPFQDAALSKLDNLNETLPHDVMSREKLERLAFDVGLDRVVRWKPRMPENLAGSGQQIVLNGAIHAIIGAISLQHGAGVAGKIIRERILAPISHQ